MISALILTLNEEKHLPRCIASLEGVVDSIFVVDSFSIDDTVAIAEEHGAKVVQHCWINYASQFNWALSQLETDTEWILRIDADEYLTPRLATEIRGRLPKLDADVKGIFCSRRMIFQARLIRFGGVFPIRVLRLFRYLHGECENRWMDEHIKVLGPTVDLGLPPFLNHQLMILRWNMQFLFTATDKSVRHFSYATSLNK